MKTLIFFFSAIFALSTLSLNAQFKIKSDGKMGFGTTSPSTLMHFKINSDPGNEILFDFPGTRPDIKIRTYMGDNIAIEPSINNKGYIGQQNKWYYIKAKYIYGDFGSVSDLRKKENIEPLVNSMLIIKKLNPIKFDFKEDEYKDMEDTELKEKLIEDGKDRVGFIAQDVLEVFPKAVMYDEELDEYYLRYNSFIPLLVDAIQEQQETIESLQTEIEILKSKDSKTKSTASSDLNNSSVLLQNKPNPFSENTYINYVISDEVDKATIYIYDLQGKQVKAMPINERGQGSAVIYGSELYAGIYHYTLITDGQIVGTYTMILTN